MTHDVLETAVRGCIESNPNPIITWHGGEPTLAGLDFFRESARIIRHLKKRKTVRQVIQTNATLVTPGFAEFFAEQGFEVGVSLDGSDLIHGLNRIDPSGNNSYEAVVRGIQVLKSAGIKPFVIATVTRQMLPYAKQVFDFLVRQEFRLIKYSPVFDSLNDQFSIDNLSWFRYLRSVLDRWVELSDPEVSVREIDEVIAWMDGKNPSLCSGGRTCRNWVSVDPDGNLYPCEYLRSSFGYGNIREVDIKDIVTTGAFANFSRIAEAKPPECEGCKFLHLCGNGCPATRIKNSKLDPSGQYIYCKQKKRLFEAVKKIFEEERR